MTTTRQGNSKLPILSKRSPLMAHRKLKDVSLPTSLPSLPSSPLIGDNRSITSRSSSNRSRVKSELSQVSQGPMIVDEERRTSSDPGAPRRTGTRNQSLSSSVADTSDLGQSISSSGEKNIPATSKTPSPSTPAPTVRSYRPRSNSVAARTANAISEENMRRSRNSDSLSELAARKDGIYEGGQSLGDEAKRRSVNSGAGGSSSPQWAGQLTHAVLELSQEINRLKNYQGAMAVSIPQQPAPPPNNKPKSTSLFWNQSAVQNAYVRT